MFDETDVKIKGLKSSDYSFDHIGIATKDMDKAFLFYKALGFTCMEQEIVESEKLKVGMIELSNSCRIELLEPIDEASPISKFIEKKGEGIHHICLRVLDIRKAVAQLKKASVRLINEVPRPGAHQTEVVFIHPKSANGVLVELSQKMSENKV